MQTVFVNPERCIGCRQCEMACAVEHSVSQSGYTAFLERPMPRARVHVAPGPVPSTSFPVRCRHCDPAPCMAVCPTGAIVRDVQLGLVLVDGARCIGCAMCAVVCPFDVITFHPLREGPDDDKPIAVKCDGCVARLQRGDEPACAEVCKVDALVFGEINELVAAGRLREAGAVLAASGCSPTPLPEGDPLAAWRGWSTAAVAIREAAGSRRNGSTPSTGSGVQSSSEEGAS